MPDNTLLETENKKQDDYAFFQAYTEVLGILIFLYNERW